MAEQYEEEETSRRIQLEKKIALHETHLIALRNALSSFPTRSSSPVLPLDHTLIPPPTPSHALLLLSDSALPLGSFAYSHGLESYLGHHPSPKSPSLNGPPASSFPHFLRLSLSSTASLSVPHLFAAYRSPSELVKHVQSYDASLPCAVARRASLAQGRALLAIWERSFKPNLSSRNSQDPAHDGVKTSAVQAIDDFAAVLKTIPGSTTKQLSYLQPQPHYPSLYGAVCRALDLTPDQAATIFLLSHVRSVISAAVRASVLGPYAAQAVLASPEIEDGIWIAVRKNSEVDVAEASQGAPVMDLWAGRHEMLYSRIFNS